MNETLSSIALTQLPHLSLMDMKRLVERAGSASILFDHRNDLKSIIPDITTRAENAFHYADEALKRAEAEMEFISRKKINVYCYIDKQYPARLRECEDAPVVLYYLGNANLNKAKIIAVVGTRKCTQYGRDICNAFISDLQRYYKDIVIVSGLAYGTDINAHKAALTNGMETVGVLAHGLDRIYPASHRNTAIEMIQQGGLLTEYVSGTTPERINFVRRNRIVAGMSDATIVVESASKGGSLITADIASSYHRDVFAFPGRVYDQYSEGCNNLIKSQKAVVIQNAEDLIDAMMWENPLKDQKDKDSMHGQLDLFPDLSPEEQTIVNLLSKNNDLQINNIVINTGLEYSNVSMHLFNMEMKGIVSVLGGARYHLIGR